MEGRKEVELTRDGKFFISSSLKDTVISLLSMLGQVCNFIYIYIYFAVLVKFLYFATINIFFYLGIKTRRISILN